MSKTSIFSLPTQKITDAKPVVENGDCVLILKKDGQVVPLTVGIDIQTLVASIKNGTATDADADTFLRGRALFALVLAAQNEAIMDILLSIADDPNVIDPDKLAALSRMN